MISTAGGTATTVLRLLFGLVVATCLQGCSEGVMQTGPWPEQFGTNAPMVLVNQGGMGVVSFSMALFSTQPIEHVDFLSLKATGADEDSFAVTVNDNDVEGLERHVYHGWHTKYILVTVTATDGTEACEFPAITLDVDGQSRLIQFPTPIVMASRGGNAFTDSLRGLVLPNGFGSSFLNSSDETAIYIFEVVEDLTMTRIHLADYVTVGSMTARIGNGTNDSGPFDVHLPLQLRAGQKLQLELSFASNVANSQTYVATTLFFDFVSAQTVETQTDSVSVEFDPISPISGDDFSKVDMIIDSLGLSQ